MLCAHCLGNRSRKRGSGSALLQIVPPALARAPPVALAARKPGRSRFVLLDASPLDAVKLNVNLPRRGMSIENEALFVRTRF